MLARMDAAVPADAQNASTATWKTAQNAVSHSAHSHHSIVRREERTERQSRFTHEIPDTPHSDNCPGARGYRQQGVSHDSTRALRQHPPYFHDGSAATLAAVVAHCNRARSLRLTEYQQRELVEYLKSR